MSQTNRLTKREKEVLELLLQGMSNKQIAVALNISERTVEYHLTNIFAKLTVSSRAELFAKLGKTPGSASAEKLGESTVDRADEYADNGGKSTVDRADEYADQVGEPILWGLGKFVRTYKIPISISVLLVAILIVILLAPAPFSVYLRECERPDEYSVGQTLDRSQASGLVVHGQFGTVPGLTWPPQPGYVKYNNIHTPEINHLYLELRYSKNSSSSVPILIFLDNEPTPRAMLFPVNQGSWNQFIWTEPIELGNVGAGTHSIRLFTDGQQYGVVDLDRFVLATEPSSVTPAPT